MQVLYTVNQGETHGMFFPISAVAAVSKVNTVPGEPNDTYFFNVFFTGNQTPISLTFVNIDMAKKEHGEIKTLLHNYWKEK